MIGAETRRSWERKASALGCQALDGESQSSEFLPNLINIYLALDSKDHVVNEDVQSSFCIEQQYRLPYLYGRIVGSL